MDKSLDSLYRIEGMRPAIEDVGAAGHRVLSLAGWMPWLDAARPKPTGLPIEQPVFRGRCASARRRCGPRTLLHRDVRGVHVEKYLGTNDQRHAIYRVRCLHCQVRVVLEGRQIRNHKRDGCGDCRPSRRKPSLANAHLVTFRGQSRTVSAWAREMTRRGTAVTRRCIQYRLARGWSEREALTTPSGRAA